MTVQLAKAARRGRPPHRGGRHQLDHALAQAPPVDQAALRGRPLVRDHARGGRAELRELDGPGTRFISVPRRRRGDLLVGDRELAGGGHRRGRREEIAGDKQLLLDRYAGWQEPTEERIQATDTSAIYRREIVDRDPIKKWGSGRVTLLGDAALAMTQPRPGRLSGDRGRRCADEVPRGQRRPSGRPARLRGQAHSPHRGLVRRSRRIGELGQWTNPIACRVERDQRASPRRSASASSSR